MIQMIRRPLILVLFYIIYFNIQQYKNNGQKTQMRTQTHLLTTNNVMFSPLLQVIPLHVTRFWYSQIGKNTKYRTKWQNRLDGFFFRNILKWSSDMLLILIEIYACVQYADLFLSSTLNSLICNHVYESSIGFCSHIVL